jgi:hypothetical protein
MVEFVYRYNIAQNNPVPEQKSEIKINKELSHTIFGVNLPNLPWCLISIFKIKKEPITEPLISDYLCI